MNVKVGSEYPWNRGGTLKVTGVKEDKVKFDVIGKVPMSGSMTMEEFIRRFCPKARKAA